MADSITIPSPSVILSSPTRPPAPLPPVPRRQKQRLNHKPDAATTKTHDPTKPKQTKSRNGCQTCKLKRLKCDETKPTCENCRKRGVQCGGYKTKFKWRQFDEQNITFKPPTQPQPAKKPRNDSRSSLPSKSPTSETPTRSSNTLPHRTINPSSHKLQKEDRPETYLQSDPLYYNVDPSLESNDESFMVGLSPTLFSALRPPEECGNWSYDNLQVTLQPSPLRTISDEVVAPDFPSEGFLEESFTGRLPSQSNFFDGQSDFSHNKESSQSFSEKDVEEVTRVTKPDQANWNSWGDLVGHLTRNRSFEPTRDGILTNIPQQPPLAIDSPEMLLKRFDMYTCGIMSVLDGPTENPWRELIWPLMHDNSIMFHAVASMASFHASRNQRGLLAKGRYHAARVLQALRASPSGPRTDVALASTLCLAFGESWDSSVNIKTGIDYIRLCKTLVTAALSESRTSPTDIQSRARLKFLCKTWIYIDVIARLTSVDDDISNDFEAVANFINGPFEAETTLDPLMGCATTLFPVVGRVANLVRQVCKLNSNTLEVVQQASQLQQELVQWVPPGQYHDPKDPTTSVVHGLQTAEAYRWATLLYLHQAVPELSSLSSAELAKKTLICLANVPLSSRAVIVQIYPLLAAGCEVTSAGDRKFVAQRWEQMSMRMAIGNIDRCADVVKEVWHRRDSYAAKLASNSAPPRRPSLKPPYAPGGIDLEAFPHWTEPFQRRASASATPRPRSMDENMRRTSADTCALTGMMDKEFSVRGSLHWVAVMKAFNWEVLLG